MTIVKIPNYPYGQLPDLCPAASWTVLRSEARTRRLAVYLECFLQVTQTHLPAETPHARLIDVAPLFVGALMSDRFVDISVQTRLSRARDFLKSLPESSRREELLGYLSGRTAPQWNVLVVAFESLALSPTQVAKWQGYPVLAASGLPIHVPLDFLIAPIGQSFVGRLHQAIRVFAAGRHIAQLPFLPEFVEFLSTYPDASPESLADSDFVTVLLRDFWRHVSQPQKVKARVLITKWSAFHFFIRKALISSGLMAHWLGTFPGPINLSERKKKGGGQQDADRKGRLLMELPMTMSDGEAWDFLLDEVPRTVDLIDEWATNQCHLARTRLELRRLFARISETERFQTLARTSADATQLVELVDYAAFYEQVGHKVQKLDSDFKFSKEQDLQTIALELGIPLATSLVPHAALLVIDHPQITPSFLDSITLVDSNDNRTGFIEGDHACWLIGDKRRKGKKAQQRVLLTPRGVRIVRELIEITASAREYLREKGDKSWQKLFLTTGKGFGFPSGVRMASETFQERFTSTFQGTLTSLHLVEPERAKQLASQFSLSALRATVGLKVFMQTHSARQMSEKLGHERFNPRLLARYLPPQVAALFYARWVRAFQLMLIIATTPNLEHRKRATGMGQPDLDKFVSDNDMQSLNAVLNDSIASEEKMELEEKGTFVLEASIDVFRTLKKLSEQVNPTGEKRFYQMLANHLLAHTRGRHGMEPNIDDAYRAAMET